MQVNTVKDTMGRNMRITVRMLQIAKHYGWCSGIADESLAEALRKARDEMDIFQQQIGSCCESAAVIDFCRGGSRHNPMIPEWYRIPIHRLGWLLEEAGMKLANI